MLTPLHVRAQQQGGVLLARQAGELGYRWDDLNAIVVAENWTRLFRGAYLHPEHPETLAVRVRAIQLRWPALVASHELAAALHGFAVVGQPALTFTAPDKIRCNVPGGVLYRWLLRPDEVEIVDGLRVSTCLRTATELMRLKSRDKAVIAVDSALSMGAVTLDALAARIERLSGDHGVRHAWRAFAVLDPKSGSPGESKTRLIMRDRDVHPRTQVRIVGPDGSVFIADFVVEGVVFEQEGFAYHGTKEAHEQDVRRFNALAIAARSSGYDFCRVTFADAFVRPRETGDLIVNTIAARRRRLSAY